MKAKIILLAAALLAGKAAQAGPPDEGMWLPMFVERLNYENMKGKGLQLTAEEIYSINNSSLKDAVVMLDGGSCSAEMISAEGLVLTNHHCAYDYIQNHSSVDKDYLKDGFWAMSREQELPNIGATASFLVRMEDVTEQVLAYVNDGMDQLAREEAIETAMMGIQQKASEGNSYDVAVKPFFNDNAYYMFVYVTYRDVRLVGAPPSAIGNFGGDTDNWMWPRHTGDFSMLRIYTAPDGSPADYSKDNVPLKPKHHLPISMKGVKEGDFAMVMGYPGTTRRYLTSYGIALALEKSNPTRVAIRGKRLELMKQDMDANRNVGIQYASKYANISNYWKYFIGQSAGLKRLKVQEKKAQIERAFAQWMEANPARKQRYGKALPLLEQGYKELADTELSNVYLNEAAFGSEILTLAWEFMGLYHEITAEAPKAEAVAYQAQQIKGMLADYFKEYNASTDQKITAALLEMYAKEVPKAQWPDAFETVAAKYKGDYKKYVAMLFAKSIFSSEAKAKAFLNAPNAAVLKKDPAMQLLLSIHGNYSGEIAQARGVAQTKIAEGMRLFTAGLREMDESKVAYPDANSTMRLTYGSVMPYKAKDAVFYDYTTTGQGILEKEIPNDGEFHVPAKLKELLEKGDFGDYADASGGLTTCFLTNNDITGGNSGSPVINGKGELIGVAFDGNWEAMSGAIAFEPDLQRCINVDIRYVLFVVDKYAGAGYLLKEMTLKK